VHPYTRMLLASVPRLDKKWDEAPVTLAGKNTDLHGGCVYYDRCPQADKAMGCDRFRPQLVEVEENHFVACYLYGEALNPAG
jgi:peptide/nickel transport system ATP-binding protein